MEQADLSSLSESQKTCLRLVAEGMSSKEIAIATGLSHQTVDQYLSKATLLLGASNRREAARRFQHLDPLFSNSELKPARLAEAQNAARTEASARGMAGQRKRIRPMGWLDRLSFLPPIGGQDHDFTMAQIVETAARIALLSVGTIIAVVIVLMGIMRLLS